MINPTIPASLWERPQLCLNEVKTTDAGELCLNEVKTTDAGEGW